VSVAQLATVLDAQSQKKQSHSVVVLLTDGTSNTGMDPVQAAGQAKQAGVPIDTVGVGQRNQTTLLGGRLVDGVDEQALQGIASATGGHYFFAADESQLNKIYSDLGTRIGFTTTKVDLTIPVLALGTLILVVAGLFSLRWFRLLP
jgi:Ca-activated chloride channel family protein